jgi:hypothetical protein
MVSESRSVQDFEELEINGSYEILLEQGDRESVFLEADENLIDLVKTERVGNTLKIFNERSIRSDEGIQIVITYRKLETISSTGAAIIENRGLLSGEFLEVDLKGTVTTG